MFFERWTRPPETSPVGKYRLEVVSSPEECDHLSTLPIELRYLFLRYPECRPRVCELLKQGKSIGVRTVLETPRHILGAVHTISVFTQENFIITWLPALLRDKHLPKFTLEDEGRASAAGHDLHAAVKIIENERLSFKCVVLVDGGSVVEEVGDRHLVKELSELIYPLSVDYAVFRVIADNANERTEIAQNIYRPCCGNSTYFPDCNHGAAMLGFIELAVAQGLPKEEIYKKALVLNSYWFPQTYAEVAIYFKVKKNTPWDKVNPKEILSASYSSGGGYKAVNKELQTAGLLPKVEGGGGCGPCPL